MAAAHHKASRPLTSDKQFVPKRSHLGDELGVFTNKYWLHISNLVICPSITFLLEIVKHNTYAREAGEFTRHPRINPLSNRAFLRHQDECKMFSCVDPVVQKSLKNWKSVMLQLGVSPVWCKIA